MIDNEKYSCVSDLGAEFLMVIIAFVVAITAGFLAADDVDQEENLFLSSAYTIFLPLMSYLFSQANQYNPDGGAQVILIWMVFIEIIRLRSDPIFTWTLRKSGAQFVRLCWVGYLICSYAPLHGIRVSLLVLCIYFGVCVVLRGILFNKAKDSYLIGKNPKIIHNYVERIMLQDDLHTTPMNMCDYIVMGEENHEIDVCCNGYSLGKKKSSSEGILTIGRVFQLSSSQDEEFTSAYPDWRDNCLSFALAKMLRQRFAKLPVEEAGCRKSLDFVLEGIIDYIGSNRDIQTDENDGGRNPAERVFSIIQEELEYISEFLHMTVPIYHYLEDYVTVDGLGVFVILGNGIYLIYTICKKSSAWLSLVVENPYNQCFLHAFRRGSMVVKIFSRLDLAITILLFIACIYIEFDGSLFSAMTLSEKWIKLDRVKRYIRDPTKWSRSQKPPSHLANSTKVPKAPTMNDKKTSSFYRPTIFDLDAETIFFCITVDMSTLAWPVPKLIRRTIPGSSPIVTFSSTDPKEAILKSLRKSDGRLTNGETSLKTHGMDHLNWACQPHASTTETILVWHITTTLLHNHQTSPHQNNDPHQETESQQNNNPFKEKEVALALSSYCYYLMKYLPDLLPDEVDFTEKMYEGVQKEILDIPLFFDQKPTKEYRCNYALYIRWVESSVVGKGARLAKDLIKCAEDEAPVWTMLADFWAEMMLFIAPSDNVDGHQKILYQKQLITQLWALLTHAGIITRPKPTKHQDHQSESNAVTGDMNV